MIKRHDSIVVQRIVRLLVPFIQIFGVYVLLHGHYSPGGGFQAGVLIGSAMILELLVGTRKELSKFSIRREFVLASFGVIIFLALGCFALFTGNYFFDYSAIPFLGDKPEMRRYWSILIAEVGLTFTVAMTLLVIFNVLAFLPKEKVTKP